MKNGLKALSIFDEIDRDILLFCNDYMANIMEIVEQVDRTHNNLKCHIDKLFINSFIEKTDNNLLTTSKSGKKLLKFLNIKKDIKIDFRSRGKKK